MAVLPLRNEAWNHTYFGVQQNQFEQWLDTFLTPTYTLQSRNRYSFDELVLRVWFSHGNTWDNEVWISIENHNIWIRLQMNENGHRSSSIWSSQNLNLQDESIMDQNLATSYQHPDPNSESGFTIGNCYVEGNSAIIMTWNELADHIVHRLNVIGTYLAQT